MMKRSCAAFVLTVALLATSFLGCDKKQAAPQGVLFGKAADNLPNIVLISIDTLRGDYFSPEHMPLTYDWAQKNCYIYTDAQSCSTWTKPSHVTMLTGLRQKEHGVEFHEDIIPPDLPMVQERLRQAGYFTIASVSGGYVEKEFGFDRGFDKFWEIKWEGHRPLKDDGEAFTRAYNYLKDSGASRQPFFLFAHTHMVHQFWADFFPGCTADEGDEPRKNFQLQASLETRRELYAAAVKECDRKLYSFVQFLVQSFPNIRIIITSDHGEGLGEYYEAGDVYKEVRSFNHESIPTPDQTYVPLIVYGFGSGITNQLVGVDDIAGTILQIAGVEPSPQKSLFKKRDAVVSEHIWEQDLVRHVAVISQGKRKFSKALDNELVVRMKDRKAAQPQKVSEQLKRELGALGYGQ